MNHMEEVAKLLGVELGEIFTVTTADKRDFDIKLTIDGVKFVNYISEGTLRENAHEIILAELLKGRLIIKRKPWKPKNNQHYYRINECGKVECDEWLSFGEDIAWYRLGNCYRTKEEAEANRDKWLAFYASDEVLEV